MYTKICLLYENIFYFHLLKFVLILFVNFWSGQLCACFGNNENIKKIVFIIFKNGSSITSILSSLYHNGSYQKSYIIDDPFKQGANKNLTL